MERYICIHAHCYQPPRENPWLEAVEVQDSAHPYHDWNERITQECYAPNTAARILDREGRIVRITNNYSRISFNFGPTLLAWLEDRAPAVYAAILRADLESQRRFSGHGSAIAQTYNHTIMPLANSADKRTQVVWGVADFVRRFGRRPEGMWLPETAVDLESLELLAEQGIRHTILAPHQARRFRKIGARHWREAGGGIDPSVPYLLHLRRSGRSIALFFYDGPISQGVAFEGLLQSGERFAARLTEGFSEQRDGPQLVHIATDGETYGHHHHRGDMALAYALHHIESEGLARITNYGEFLEQHPPTHEVEIHENTAWSCAHEVGRWWRDCGCSSGAHPDWEQAWRTPLRDALDRLRDELAPRYEEGARELLRDPWRARNDYIAVVLDRGPESRRSFLADNATRELSAEERVRAWKWLELQRHAMLMYTSCGWFFDELSGIETVQVIQYAARAVQLAADLGIDEGLEGRFREALAEAKSNLAEHGDGARIYERSVRPAMVDLPKVGAHYAITSLFDDHPDRSRIYCYEVERAADRRHRAGAARLAVGRARVTSEITRESTDLSFAVLHFGDHNLNAAVRSFRGEEPFEQLRGELGAAFERAELAEVIRLMDHHFQGATYSLKQLFRDDQRRIVAQILDTTLAEAAASYRQVYQRDAALMRFLRDMRMPQPRALVMAAEFVLDSELRGALAAEKLDLGKIASLAAEASSWGAGLDGDELRYAVERTLDRLADRFSTRPRSPETLEEVGAIVDLALRLPGETDLWKIQNVYYELLQKLYPDTRRLADSGDEAAARWVRRFDDLGRSLDVRAGDA